MTKIIVTGGHHNSALVVAERLRQKGFRVTWIGHRYTMIGDPHDSLEYQEVTAAGFPFINSLAGKFHPKAHVLHWFKIPLGFLQALWVIAAERPRLIVTFGGYVAVPVAIVGKLFGIPLVAFEQTATIGRANQIIGRLADKTFLAWQSSLGYFPAKTSEVIGLPIRPELLKPLKSLRFKTKGRPLLVVTGGKQGAHVINEVVFKLVPALLRTWDVLHQTGASLLTSDFQTALKRKETLPSNVKTRYLPIAHLSWREMIQALKEADVVVSRAGAHIAYELLALKKRAILIPLPFSYRDEQRLHAQKLTLMGLGMMVSQRELTPPRLLKALTKLHQKSLLPEMPHVPTNATEIAVKFIEDFCHAPHSS